MNAFEHDELEPVKGEDGSIWGKDERGLPFRRCLRYTLEDVTRKTFLNRAIMGCQDLEQLESIIDAYADVFPEIFAGACYKPLLELLPIHTAIRAKRLEVVQMLVNKGLAPEKVDLLLSEGLIKVKSRVYTDNHIANPFNVALALMEEDMCLVLIKNSNGPFRRYTKYVLDSHDDSSGPAGFTNENNDSDDGPDDDLDDVPDDDTGIDWEARPEMVFYADDEPIEVAFTSVLKIAEDAGMYRLLPLLLQNWKQVPRPRLSTTHALFWI